MSQNTYQDHDYGITTIDTGLMRPSSTASHLILEDNLAAFIDVGSSLSIPKLLFVLDQKGVSREDVAYVIVTHVHLDHAGGAGRLMEKLPNAQLIVHPRGARHLVNPAKLQLGASSVYGEDIFKKYFGDLLPIPAERVIEAKDGDIVRLKERPFEFLDTPGHAKHHICVHDKCSRSIFSGDNFGISFREFDTLSGLLIYPSTAPVHFDPDEMHKSIDRLLSYNPEKIYLTHYGEVKNVKVLGVKLHSMIEEFVTLVVTYIGNPEERYAYLVENLFLIILKEIRLLGCTLSDERCRELLTMDLEINSKGLEYWRDHN